MPIMPRRKSWKEEYRSSRAFPDHAFLGEEESVGKERSEETRPPADSPPLWVVDPLDGTANYVHDVPAYCVSISACGPEASRLSASFTIHA